MAQLYLLEIMVDKIDIHMEDGEESKKKKLTTQVMFGPTNQINVHESPLLPNNELPEDIVTCDENGQKQWSRLIRVGRSYLFFAYPDTLIATLGQFPLEAKLWTDDEKENPELIGTGKISWDTDFYEYLREYADPYEKAEPFIKKQIAPLTNENTGKMCGKVEYLLRFSPLGKQVQTEYQQLFKDPENFVFRTNKAPGTIRCTNVEEEEEDKERDVNFCMIGSIYESMTLDDPGLSGSPILDVCTDMGSCATARQGEELSCQRVDEPRKKLPVEKIKMGDIVGPCGNPNCSLAQKVKQYIRTLDKYKKNEKDTKGNDESPKKNAKDTKGNDESPKKNAKDTKGNDESPKDKICGKCICKDIRWHRDSCPEKNDDNINICAKCAAEEEPDTDNKAEEKLNTTEKQKKTETLKKQSSTGIHSEKNSSKTGSSEKHQSKETSPNKNNNQVNFAMIYCMSGYSNYEGFHSDTKLYHSMPIPSSSHTALTTHPSEAIKSKSISCMYDMCHNSNVNIGSKKSSEVSLHGVFTNMSHLRNQQVYNVNTSSCCPFPIDNNCNCDPPRPPPNCKGFDCECIRLKLEAQSRKKHKPFCPNYKHKANCPVRLENEEDKLEEDEEDAPEELPYGLPPIKLGPCPVIGRPCTVPHGFQRMYKIAAIPPAPPTHSDAGKVCCSKEFERIKKALTEYMKYEKGNEYRCINKFNEDTEKRCCDKEQTLLCLTGRSCCGEHKMKLQDEHPKEK